MMMVRRLVPRSMGTLSNCRFSQFWKKKEEASEKIYISKEEKVAMKKLMSKIQNEEQDEESNLEEFERLLKGIMKRYKIQDQDLAEGITNLHYKYTHC